MHQFRGRLVSHEGGSGAELVTVAVDGDWVRIWSDHKRYGAWSTADVACERVTVFRFTLELDGKVHTFTPEDPAGFAEAIGAVIDLRPTSRFGLADRVRAAKESLAATRAGQEPTGAD